MMPESCPRARSAAQAGRSGKWNDELAAHVKACPSCGESSLVARWMTALAEGLDLRLPPVADPDLVWLRARLLGRSRQSDRALLPIRIAGAVTALGSAAVLATLPGEGWNPNWDWLTSAATGWADVWDLPLSLPITALWAPAAIIASFLLVFTWNEA